MNQTHLMPDTTHHQTVVSAGYQFTVFVYKVPTVGVWTATIRTPEGYIDNIPYHPTEEDALEAVGNYFAQRTTFNFQEAFDA